MTDPTATNTDLAHAATGANIDASGYLVGVELRVPRSVVRELVRAGVPAFGLCDWGAC